MIHTLLDKLFHRPKPTWFERHFFFTLCMAALIAMTISLVIGLQQSVWFDEAYSILLAKQPVAQLVHLTSVDTHPPLYYLFLKGWAHLFGWSAFALRSLSVVAMGGALVMGGLLVRRLFNVRAAVVALPFITFAPFLLRYGFEIRMYALASLIGIAATYVLVRALQATSAKEQTIYYIFYAVLVALGVFTLYYTVLLWLAHVVWLVWQECRHVVPAVRYKRVIIKQPWTFAILGSVLLFLPWLPTFIFQFTHNALAPIAHALTVENLTGIVSFTFLYMPSWQLNGLLSLVLLAVIIAVTVLIMNAFKQASSNEKSHLSLFMIYWAIPVLFIALISLINPMYVERYLSHILIGASILVGVSVAIAARTNKKMWLVGIGLLVVMVGGVINLSYVGNYNFQRLQKPVTKDIARVYGCDNTTYITSGPFAYIESSYELNGCDLRFYATETPEFHGGFAPLHNSDKRLTSTNQLSAKRLLLVDFNENHKELIPDSRYHFVSSTTYGAVQVIEYEK